MKKIGGKISVHETIIKALPKGKFFSPALQFFFPNHILANMAAKYVNAVKLSNSVVEFPFDEIFKFWDIIPKNNLVVESESYDYYMQYLNNLQNKEKRQKLVEYKVPLFDYQDEAVTYSLEHDKWLLAFEPGLGKTAVAINVAINNKLNDNFKHCLVLAGFNSLKENWKEEIERFSNEKARILGRRVRSTGKIYDAPISERIKELTNNDNEFFLIANIEMLQDDDFMNAVEKLCLDGTIGMVIVDEIHKAKGIDTKQGQNLLKLKSKYRLGLTATPLLNSSIDLYNILVWLDVVKTDITHYEEKFCNVFYKKRKKNRKIIYEKFYKGAKNQTYLKQLLESVTLYKVKQGLPPKFRYPLLLELYPAQSKVYNVVSNLENKFLYRKGSKPLFLVPNKESRRVRMKQATTITSELDPNVKENIKFDVAVKIAKDVIEKGDKIVIFSFFERAIAELKKVLEERLNLPIIEITGKSDVNTQEEVNKFRDKEEYKILIGTFGAAGTGLNMQVANHMVFLDLPDNYANLTQYEDRIHRIGSKKEVHIYYLLAKNTIDIDIFNLIAEKKEITDAIINVQGRS